MDLHWSRSLVAVSICCVFIPPLIISFILSRSFFLGLPLLRLPAILPVKASFSRASALITWPKNCDLAIQTVDKSSLLPPIISRLIVLLLLSVQLTLSILLQHHIYIASGFFSISLLTVKASQPYSSEDTIYISLWLEFLFQLKGGNLSIDRSSFWTPSLLFKFFVVFL